jgi:hypothetical protein
MPGTIQETSSSIRADHAAADLLIACARASISDAGLEAVRAAVEADALDWPLVVSTAKDHGVMPVLHRGIERAGVASAVPTAVWQELQSFVQKNARRNLYLMQSLLRLIAALRMKNVRVLPYKGPLLALLAYGDLSMRQCGDLDIVTPKSDVPTARQVLKDLGYELMEKMDAEQEARYVASPHQYDFAYINADKTVMIELHWQVTGRFLSFDPDPVDLWERSAKLTLFGASMNMLTPEDLLLILCAHGTKHFWTRLTWICDIALLLRKYPAMDWSLVLRRADELGARGMTLLSLELANQVLGAELSPEIHHALRPTHLAQAEELALRLFDPASKHDEVRKGARMQLTGGGLFESLIFHFKTRESWASGMRYIFHRALTPNPLDMDWVRLPRPLNFLYYLVRPVRLLSLYGPLPLSRKGRSLARSAE